MLLNFIQLLSSEINFTSAYVRRAPIPEIAQRREESWVYYVQSSPRAPTVLKCMYTEISLSITPAVRHATITPHVRDGIGDSLGDCLNLRILPMCSLVILQTCLIMKVTSGPRGYCGAECQRILPLDFEEPAPYSTVHNTSRRARDQHPAHTLDK